MTRGKTMAATAALLCWSVTARAATLPVTYDVDDKALKAAVSGTMLTFELYSDAACTSLVTTQSVAIDDTKITRLKLATPSGAAKPPKTDTIHAVLGAMNIAGGAFLKVTGTGITPVGGDCQPQATGSSGKVVSVSTLYGSAGTATTTVGNVYAFASPTVTVGVTSSQYIVASAMLPMVSADSQFNVVFDLCYQPNAGGPLVNFAGSNYAIAPLETGITRPFPVSGAAAPGEGFWKVGYCVMASGAHTIDVDYVNGWVMVMQ